MRSFASLHYFVYWLLFVLGSIEAFLQLLVNTNVIVFAILGFLIYSYCATVQKDIYECS